MNKGGVHFNLASIHNAEENDFIMNMILKKVGNIDTVDLSLPWIGLYRPPHSTWNYSLWVDGSPVVYTNWAANEPSNVCI